MAQMTQAPPAVAEAPPAWYALPGSDVAEQLRVDVTQGLSTGEAAERTRRYGANRFAEAATEPRWRAFVRQYRDPMQIVLLVAGIGSIYPLHELGTGLVLLFLTLFNAVLGLRQEGKAAEAVAALQKMMIVKARVRRDGALTPAPRRAARPGRRRRDRGRRRRARRRPPAVGRDARGRRVGADGREPARLEGHRAARQSIDTPLGDRTDMVYMNTNVTRGAGSFVVTSTGMSTEVGHISGHAPAAATRTRRR